MSGGATCSMGSSTSTTASPHDRFGVSSSRGLAPEAVPDEPDEVLFETIRRFKGMEREVAVLAELPVVGDRLDELLYVLSLIHI